MKKLYLITGFLGAGKTTFINNMFSVFKDKKTAVIVNEFGKTGIDGDVIRERGFEVSEINSGSIFCVCRSDKFIEVLLEGFKSDADVLLVETSGLSDPTSMDNILENLNKYYTAQFDYRGCICFVDAKNFRKIYDTAVVTSSQIKEASLVVINKIDSASIEEIESIEKIIRLINDKCDIIHTTYSKIPKEKIISLIPIENQIRDNKVDILSSSTTILFEDNFSFEKIKDLLDNLKMKIYRCKGNVSTDKGNFFIDGVMDNIQVAPINTLVKDNSIVFLYNLKNHVYTYLKEFCKNNNCKLK